MQHQRTKNSRKRKKMRVKRTQNGKIQHSRVCLCECVHFDSWWSVMFAFSLIQAVLVKIMIIIIIPTPTKCHNNLHTSFSYCVLCGWIGTADADQKALHVIPTTRMEWIANLFHVMVALQSRNTLAHGLTGMRIWPIGADVMSSQCSVSQTRTRSLFIGFICRVNMKFFVSICANSSDVHKFII